VAELFSLYGEAYYRQIEHVCLAKLLLEDRPMVLATGGGVVEHLQSYDLLLRCALTVWLSAAAETLWARVVAQGDPRPMAGRETALAQLRLLLLRREALYKKAQLKLGTEGAEPNRLVAQLVEEIQWLRADKAQLRQEA
jgi:XRE family aerobic/anaerobic benzoate catabolism transcriptional regulator